MGEENWDTCSAASRALLPQRRQGWHVLLLLRLGRSALAPRPLPLAQRRRRQGGCISSRTTRGKRGLGTRQAVESMWRTRETTTLTIRRCLRALRARSISFEATKSRKDEGGDLKKKCYEQLL